MHHKRHCSVLAAVTAAMLIASAAPRSSARPLSVAVGQKAETSSQVVIDGAGRRVVIPAKVKRIVTLAPNLTEIVYALGLGNELVGDTNEADTPPEAKRKPHVGEPQDPSLEAIVAQHPDLVLATTSINRVETVDALGRLGIPVYTSNPHTVGEMLKSIARMAELMGARERGAELSTRLQQQLDALKARLAGRPVARVLFVVWDQPLITIGRNTFIADALRWAGTESVVQSRQNWPQLSLEEVFRLQPDYIVFAGHPGEDAATELAQLRARSVWRDLNAVKKGHVMNLGEEALRPAPGLIDAIEKLAREIHPRAFAESADARKSGRATQRMHRVYAERMPECKACAR